MPSRNVLKIDIDDSYYHAYARGASRNKIFKETADYEYFLKLFIRYLSDEVTYDSAGRPYPQLVDHLELLAYCLMPNHFHLMYYQKDAGSISTLMRSVMTSYSRYFNKKYKRSGPLFETRYKSSRISNDTYLMHISRYIHLNHQNWKTWKWSSYMYYKNNNFPHWLSPEKVLGLFPSTQKYLDFVADYENAQRIRDEIKLELANG